MTKQPKKFSARFALVFMLVLALISFGVYLTFSTFQGYMALKRGDLSGHNLAAINQALEAYAAKNGGQYPERAALLTHEFLPDESVLSHPAWPDNPGYIYFRSVRTDDDSTSTLLAAENVPERKRKLGILVLKIGGTVERLTEAQFTSLLKAQENRWKHSGRIWMPEEMQAHDTN